MLSSPFPGVFFWTWLFIIQLLTTSNLLKPESPLKWLYGHRRKVKYVKPWCVREWGALGLLQNWSGRRPLGRQWNSKKKKVNTHGFQAPGYQLITDSDKWALGRPFTPSSSSAWNGCCPTSSSLKGQLKFHLLRSFPFPLPLDALALYLCLIYHTSNSAFLWRYLSNGRRLPKG